MSIPEAEALSAELDTDWAPDPWAWTAPPGNTRLLEGISDQDVVTLPFVGGRRRRVTLLPFSWRAALHSVGATLAWRARKHLRSSVFGYTATNSRTLSHYRAEYSRRLAREIALMNEYPWRATLDIARFFESTSLEWLIRSTAPYIRNTVEQDVLNQLGSRLVALTGSPLPAGYGGARALANLCLLDIDKHIESPFTRWVDDYRLFSPNERAAHEALTTLRGVVEASPYSVAARKSAVDYKTSTDGEAEGSLLDDHPEITDVEKAITELSHAWSNTSAVCRERRLRHLLRLSAERQEPAALGPVRDIAEQGFPAAAIPRLAWYLSTVADKPDSWYVLREQLQVDDEYRVWRTLRLAPAIWFFPRQAATPMATLLEEGARRSPAVHIAVARVQAKHHGTQFLSAASPDSPDVRRALSLARREHDFSDLPPPMRTFL